MKACTTTFLCACMALAAGAAAAADSEKKTNDAAMTYQRNANVSNTVTMEQCKDHMAMAKKAGAKKDDASMKMDAACADVMKNAPAPKK